MFKNKIKQIKQVTSIVKLEELENITSEKNISYKSSYNKDMTRLKRGLYSLDKNIEAEKVANNLVTPSYISLETVLSYHSLIPDATVVYTSITPKQTKTFSNDYGTFYYKNLKKDLYFGYKYENGVFVAEKEKALLDYFYLKSKSLKLNIYDYNNIEKEKYSTAGCKNALTWFKYERFDNLEILDFEKLLNYSEKFNKKVKNMTKLLIHYYKLNEQEFTEIL